MQTWLGEDNDDMDWLANVYGAPSDMKCAILTGNEDSPAKIEAWKHYNPHFEASPDWVWEPSL